MVTGIPFESPFSIESRTERSSCAAGCCFAWCYCCFTFCLWHKYSRGKREFVSAALFPHLFRFSKAHSSYWLHEQISFDPDFSPLDGDDDHLISSTPVSHRGHVWASLGKNEYIRFITDSVQDSLLLCVAYVYISADVCSQEVMGTRGTSGKHRWSWYSFFVEPIRVPLNSLSTQFVLSFGCGSYS